MGYIERRQPRLRDARRKHGEARIRLTGLDSRRAEVHGRHGRVAECAENRFGTHDRERVPRKHERSQGRRRGQALRERDARGRAEA